jgi:hypothetical protein
MELDYNIKALYIRNLDLIFNNLFNIKIIFNINFNTALY